MKVENGYLTNLTDNIAFSMYWLVSVKYISGKPHLDRTSNKPIFNRYLTKITNNLVLRIYELVLAKYQLNLTEVDI